ncbi:MAG: uridine kinase [Akkermansiaceae bacterium]|jgi:uridine kinase|nr:uridine kinase [Akkermansiaceae bacterium]
MSTASQNCASPRIIAITGGSGSGKSYLARQLHDALAPQAIILTLDHFYLDLSHLPHEERELVNFDDPAAIDWPSVEAALNQLLSGKSASIPDYDFTTHTRTPNPQTLAPAPFIVLEGLWPLTRSAIREICHLSIFVDCPDETRFARRLARDTSERGRSAASVQRQYEEQVRPMHDLHVQPQIHLADITLTSPFGDEEISAILNRLRPIPA